MGGMTNGFGNLFAGKAPIVQNGDPWSGLRTVGQQAPISGNHNLHNLFGSMAAAQPQQQAQFSPVQFGGNQSGNDLAQLIAAMMQQRQGQ